MKFTLNDENASIRKCAILVGSPDWPTSVLCAVSDKYYQFYDVIEKLLSNLRCSHFCFAIEIMGLDLFPVLWGTLPVIFLIVPTVLAGSFAYMGSLRTDDGQLEFP